MSKFLIVGLGNIGDEYAGTRHNIGFEIADALAHDAGTLFRSDRLASVAEFKFKGKQIILIKPTTYMNLSGKAVNYWMQAEKINIEKKKNYTKKANNLYKPRRKSCKLLDERRKN